MHVCSVSLPFAAYLMGMILTFIVMLLSGMGQPALLYLVPFTLITSTVLAKCRGELKQFWTGTPYEVRDIRVVAAAQDEETAVRCKVTRMLPLCFKHSLLHNVFVKVLSNQHGVVVQRRIVSTQLTLLVCTCISALVNREP